MTHYYFIKLYHEILHDPKMGKLSDHVWRRCIELFLLAGEYDRDGMLPPMDDMCWTLRADITTLGNDLTILETAGILHVDDDANIIVTNFVKRQSKQTGAERVERYRERKRKENNSVTKSYNNVTEPVTNTVPDIDIDIEVDIDKNQPLPLNNIFTYYEDNIGPLSPAVSDKLKELEKDYSGQWIIDAMEQAVTYQKRNIAYFTTILRNWQANGRDNKSGKNGKEKPYIPEDHASEVYQ